jgi:hypothetical protein
MKGRADVDVEKRLLEDAVSFTRGAASLDEEGFISRTLAALGILPKDSDKAPDNEIAPEAGRTQRPAPAGDSTPGALAKSKRNK